MYLMADFARRVGSKDKKKRTRKYIPAGILSMATGAGLLYGANTLDRDGLLIRKEKYKHHNSIKPKNAEQKLASQFEEELARRNNKYAKVEKIPEIRVKPFGGKFNNFVKKINRADPAISANAKILGSILLGGIVLTGGSKLIEKYKERKLNKGKK
jgi:hypothetical protein